MLGLCFSSLCFYAFENQVSLNLSLKIYKLSELFTLTLVLVIFENAVMRL